MSSRRSSSGPLPVPLGQQHRDPLQQLPPGRAGPRTARARPSARSCHHRRNRTTNRSTSRPGSPSSTSLRPPLGPLRHPAAHPTSSRTVPGASRTPFTAPVPGLAPGTGA